MTEPARIRVATAQPYDVVVGHHLLGELPRLLGAGVKRVLDVRLNNTSQLAGYSKRDDLAYFLRAIGGIGYVHLPDLAPTAAPPRTDAGRSGSRPATAESPRRATPGAA